MRGTVAQRIQQLWASHPPPPAPGAAQSPWVTPEALLNWKGPLVFSHYFLVLLENSHVTVGVSWVLGPVGLGNLWGPGVPRGAGQVGHCGWPTSTHSPWPIRLCHP